MAVTFNDDAIRQMERLEVVQSMYAYSWSKGVFCIFMNRYIQESKPDDLDTLKDFIKSFNGFNVITRPLWRKVMKLDI